MRPTQWPAARSRGLAARVLFTVGTLGFFGPLVRDLNTSHLLNPTWVGHARVHVMWLMCFGFLSGLVNLHLIWSRRAARWPALPVVLAWQLCNIAGFWASGVTSSLYGGVTSVEGIHLHLLGVEESTLFFAVMSAVVLAGAALLPRTEGERRAE